MPGVVHLIKKNSSAAFQQICVHILTRKILNVQRMLVYLELERLQMQQTHTPLDTRNNGNGFRFSLMQRQAVTHNTHTHKLQKLFKYLSRKCWPDERLPRFILMYLYMYKYTMKERLNDRLRERQRCLGNWSTYNTHTSYAVCRIIYCDIPCICQCNIQLCAVNASECLCA